MSPPLNSHQRALIIGLILIGILTVGFFGLRTFHAFSAFRGHRPPPPPSAADAEQIETDVELIRDWMTIPFISRMYHVPPQKLFDALEIPRQGNQEKSLAQLNEEYFPQADGILMEKVKATVLATLADQLPQMEGNPGTPVVPDVP